MQGFQPCVESSIPSIPHARYCTPEKQKRRSQNRFFRHPRVPPTPKPRSLHTATRPLRQVYQTPNAHASRARVAMSSPVTSANWQHLSTCHSARSAIASSAVSPPSARRTHPKCLSGQRNVPPAARSRPPLPPTRRTSRETHPPDPHPTHARPHSSLLLPGFTALGTPSWWTLHTQALRF